MMSIGPLPCISGTYRVLPIQIVVKLRKHAHEQVPMVKPGDASMASPFTAKADGIMPCTDIVRQGRATLVTTLQMFKILGLVCLQTAYSLSVQYLQVSEQAIDVAATP